MSALIAVFFDEPDIDEYPLSIPMYRNAYRELNAYIMQRGGQFVVARGQESFLGGNRFLHSWSFSEEGFSRVDEPIEADVVFDKGHFHGDSGTNLLNDPALDALCTDKFAAYRRFPQFCPVTLFAGTKDEFAAALQKICTSLAVYKPQFGEGGSGVVIATPEELLTQELGFPGIVQEFIDMSAGIPGILEGRHDLRLIHMNDELVLSYIRTPPPGTYLANVSRGGKEIEVDLDAIPQEVRDIEKAIDADLATFGKRNYCIDLGRDVSGKWYVIELNAKPGLEPKETGKRYGYTLERLADLLVDATHS